MNKINLFITEANNNLSAKKSLILNAVKVAEEYAFSKLKIDWDIENCCIFAECFLRTNKNET